MTGQLTHYAGQPLTFDPSRKYGQREPRVFGKPEGLWVSVDGEDDWPTWCRGEEFCIDQLAVEHAVTLASDANVLHLGIGHDLDAFHGLYAIETDFERHYRAGSRQSWPIDWRHVAEDYDGIIIAPYRWSHRLKMDWYYGWDAASGCIWNLDAIASMTATSAVTS